MEELLQVLLDCRLQGRECVMAVIVKVDGSAYRREGARCLIMPDGEVTGILSGGCIEEDLRGHAAGVLESGEPCRVFYDFRAGEDDVWGTGIGCNGAITVWLEPYAPSRFPGQAERILEDLRSRLLTRNAYETATVLSSTDSSVYPPGTRLTLSGGTLSEKPGEVRKAGMAERRVNGVRLELLVERITPRPEMVIIGAGEDARVLCSMAKMLQWRVTILYHLTDKVSRERFTDADEIRIIPRLAFEQADAAGKYVVILTHNLELDREAVRRLLPEDAAYIGLVGSRYRLERILEGIEAEHHSFDRTLLGKLYSPAGLDIGAETPQEIAMSIIAEATALRNGKSGGPLRDRKGLPLPISARDKLVAHGGQHGK
ncbi:XdhC family protein [Paenibacillus sp. S150]|uniref:XdhC family protein n=1 Tax=Paenibacillus sp. S150 TaxID=2749826 RepID=UPI001C576914|nr:XdhC family protein [Paenibacillus sp. S150]MBW4084580.1 XdhC family protein [Paenibacillus sp. S150]